MIALIALQIRFRGFGRNGDKAIAANGIDRAIIVYPMCKL
jgi:hypothetical protein